MKKTIFLVVCLALICVGCSLAADAPVVNTPVIVLGDDTEETQVLSASFSPDGSQIVTACLDGVGRIWDVESGEELHKLVGHYVTCSFADFSPDGKRVITGCGVSFVTGIEGGHVLVFDADSGEMLHRLLGHRGLVRFGTFSPDGKKIASISSDSVRIWDMSAIKTEGDNP